ncbi:DNA-binding protein [Dissulfurispira thermophila]|uniref:DNA-binding protein n=2 Tax=root TaxID=1 RepID=A0A7G1GZC5_9BACT|nr:helix-turn-helix transcriptional regulator [Dissulfurispira thermophila]BCB95840.1 DNA-binding protein [Dissulfurispira thermophila]
MRASAKTIGQIVKEYRRAKGMSQMDLAEAIGVSYQQVQKYEKGINKISVDRLKQIANALDVTITEFFIQEKLTVSETQVAYGKLTDDEQLLLHSFREIKNKKIKKAIIEFIKTMAKKTKAPSS